ncbi:hypothetical protein DPMN_157050, partial [Dreissena polymorpha]
DLCEFPATTSRMFALVDRFVNDSGFKVVKVDAPEHLYFRRVPLTAWYSYPVTLSIDVWGLYGD